MSLLSKVSGSDRADRGGREPGREPGRVRDWEPCRQDIWMSLVATELPEFTYPPVVGKGWMLVNFKFYA